MSPSNIAVFEALRLVGFASINSSYTLVGSATDHPVRMFRLVNDTDKDMLVSFDGVTDHFYIPNGSFVLYDLCTNREASSNMFMLSRGAGFYLKYVDDPGSGNFAIETCYGRGQ